LFFRFAYRKTCYMYLIVFVLNRTEHLNEILEKLVEIGIRGATILDSKGMGQTFMECESPIVGGLRKMFIEQCRSNNVTVFSVVESRSRVDVVVKEIEKFAGDLRQPGTGIVFTIALDCVKGLSERKL